MTAIVPRISDALSRVIVMCGGGHQPSLAAATLREPGLHRAAGLAGGFRAWRAAGVPIA